MYLATHLRMSQDFSIVSLGTEMICKYKQQVQSRRAVA
jgi:hypothetical protein